jgi:hypothetical protein
MRRCASVAALVVLRRGLRRPLGLRRHGAEQRTGRRTDRVYPATVLTVVEP